MVSSNCTRNPASIFMWGRGQDVEELYGEMPIATASFSFLFHLFKAGVCGHVRLFAKMSLDSLFQPQFPYPDEFVLGPHLPFFQGGIFSLPKGFWCRHLRDQENSRLITTPSGAEEHRANDQRGDSSLALSAFLAHPSPNRVPSWLVGH